MQKILIALAVSSAFAAPALAQSFDPDFGTGNLQAFSPAPAGADAAYGAYGYVTPAVRGAIRHGGLRARAMVPTGDRFIGPNSPAATGGGSLGYNEMLLEY